MSGDITANPDGEIAIDGIPVSKCLGFMVGYTVQSCLVPVDEFKAKAKEIGLPECYIPKDPKEEDAFKVAIRSIETRQVRIIPDIGECRVEYKVDKPYQTHWHTISERTFGKAEGSDEFSNLVDQKVLFNVRLRITGEGKNRSCHIDMEDYDPEQSGDMELRLQMHSQIQEEFANQVKNYHGNYIRRAIRKFIFSNGGIPYTVSNGGTFFMPIKSLELAQKWEALIDWLRSGSYSLALRRYNGAGSRFVIKAVLDTEKERLYVMEDVQAELSNKYREWIKDLLYNLKSKDDEEFIENMIRRRLAKKSELTQDLCADFKELLGKEIKFELSQDIIEDVQNFRLKNGKKPSNRLQGLFSELLEV